jgi:hypothetical protein
MIQDIAFECADFRQVIAWLLFIIVSYATMQVDWSDADIVWANSTCFSKPLMQALAEHSHILKEV